MTAPTDQHPCCEEYERVAGLNRRRFLAGMAATGAAVTATSLFGEAVRQTSYAAGTAGQGGNVLVVLSLRGGIDGLGMVVPHGDPAYYTARPNLALPKNSLVAADEMFGLHPNLSPLSWLWDSGELAAVHAVGLPVPNRSHFSAMEEVEDADPGQQRPTRLGQPDDRPRRRLGPDRGGPAGQQHRPDRALRLRPDVGGGPAGGHLAGGGGRRTRGVSDASAARPDVVRRRRPAAVRRVPLRDQHRGQGGPGGGYDVHAEQWCHLPDDLAGGRPVHRHEGHRPADQGRPRHRRDRHRLRLLGHALRLRHDGLRPHAVDDRGPRRSARCVHARPRTRSATGSPW